MQRQIIAIVGLPGAGKTEASHFLEQAGLYRIRFGDITDEHLKSNNLEFTEENEKRIREYLREKEGKEAYAKLNLEKIKTALETNHVVIDGMYSWEEYMYLKERFNEHLVVLAIYAPPAVRHIRLTSRPQRSLSKEEAISRDISQLSSLNQGAAIAMADHTIINIKTLIDLREEVNTFLTLFLSQ